MLEPLGPRHADADHAAWSGSIEHIRATPGFSAGAWSGDEWPFPMSAEANRADLVQHAAEFVRGEAFAYSVLTPERDEVVGCVYVDPDETGAAAAKVRCWVRRERAELDGPLAAAVAAWLGSAWRLPTFRFPGRPHLDR